MAGHGGAREGAGRPPGTPNKRTLETMALAQQIGATDPIVSMLRMHDWAIKQFKKAERALADFDKAEKRCLAELEAAGASRSIDDRLNAARLRGLLVLALNEAADRVANYATKPVAYLHPRLSSIDAQVAHSSHEASLDDLDDDGADQTAGLDD